MAGPVSPSQPTGGPWNLDRDGIKQLAEIYAMQRQQDVNLWSQTGMFAATNGVLIIALFSAMGKAATEYELEMSFGFIGLVMCLCWFLITLRASTRAFAYKSQAKQLQDDLGIPNEHRVWHKEEPPGIASSNAYWVIVLIFSGVWAYSAVYGASQLGDLHLAAAMFFVIIVSAIAACAYRTWRDFRKKGVSSYIQGP